MNFKSFSFKQLISGLFVFISLSVSAQRKRPTHIDSLLKQLPAAKEDTNKANLLIKLGQAYSGNEKTDSAVIFLQRSLQVEEKLKWQKGMTRTFYYLGAYYFHKQKPDYAAAQTNLSQAAELSYKIGDYPFSSKSAWYCVGAIQFQNNPIGAVNYLAAYAERFKKANQIPQLINTYALLGDYSQNQFNYTAAADYYGKALKLQETAKHNYIRAYDIDAMAGLYFNLHDIKKAKTLFLKAIAIDKQDTQAGNESDLANIYIGLAQCAETEHDDKAEANYYNKAIEVSKKVKGYNTLCEIENEISWHYFLKKEYDKAYVHARNALSIKADLFSLAYAFGTMGAIYREAPDYVIKKAGLKPGQRYPAAVALSLKAISFGQSHGDAVLVKDNLKELSLTYEKMNRSADALKAYKAYITKKDSTDNLKNEKAVLLKEAQLNYLHKEDSLNYKQHITSTQLKEKKQQSYFFIGGIAALLLLSLFIALNYRNQRRGNRLLSEQREEITIQRDQLANSLTNLKTAQTQLIQSEKMASLGELTAGIAHEIQNPLNFVNNFSEVNVELMGELDEELNKGDIKEARVIAADVKQNLEKIHHHGKRADGIVKGMLEHSRASTGQKEPTAINNLVDEYLRLSYHGMRAKDKSFNAELITNFDKNIFSPNIIPQDIGRVLLNLFNNAFYATQLKKKSLGEEYKPMVTVITSTENNWITIKVKDNGNGIPDHIKDKIMQPFFTTKPTGEGTGLGLSLSYDIVIKGHGGTINIESTDGEGSEFTIALPG